MVAASVGHVSFEEGGASRTRQAGQYEDVADDYFSGDGSNDGNLSPRSAAIQRAGLSIRIPPNQMKTDTAFAALQYLPMPVLVLSSAKDIVLANEAMGRLFGIDVNVQDSVPDPEGDDLQPLPSKETESATEILYGVTLPQLGIDLLQNGNPVFVAWEDFLETIVDDAATAQSSDTQLNTHHPRDAAPRTPGRPKRSSSAASTPLTNRRHTEVHDCAVNVVFSTSRDPRTGLPLTSRNDSSSYIEAQMLVSVWANEDEQFFTLTFTATSAAVTDGAKTTTRTVARSSTSKALSSGLSSTDSSDSPGQRRQQASYVSTPTSGVTSSSSHQFIASLPRGPPAKSSTAAAPSMFGKANRLKDAILNSMNIPAYAMWKDASFGIPNKAIVKLVYPWIEDGAFENSEQARDFLKRYTLYQEDFSAEIPFDDFPINRLMRERIAFQSYRVGMYSAKDGSRMLFEVNGEPLTDDKGEFLGGLVLFHDVTDYIGLINSQRRINERQFEEISNWQA